MKLRSYESPTSRSVFPALVSEELLSKVDGDVLFLIADAVTGTVDVHKALRQLQTDPLWLKLNVVKQDKVYAKTKPR
jgi:ABC-type Fe3+-hydroxamate transport system substrate-binding protein